MTHASTRVSQVDVFTSEAYGGNPAGVCILDDDRDDRWMGLVAREMACTNTAFARLRPDGDGYDLRWYTGGGIEVALCGHATLATAHILFESKKLSHAETARFHTKSGILTAYRSHNGDIEMDFPVEIAEPVATPPAGLLQGLGCDAVWVGRNRLDYVVEVASETIVRQLTPNLGMLAEIDTRGIVVTARADVGAGYDYVLRFFAPRVGVPEDLVTGTAHCALGPYWKDRFADGRTSFTAYQASVRGGAVGATVSGDRVLIGGKAVTVLSGELRA